MLFLVTPVPSSDQSELIDVACKRSGLSRKQVAAIYGVSPEQLYQQARGIGHLSLRRLLAMARDEDGKKFLRAYMPLVWKAMGFPDLDEAMEIRDMFVRLINRVQVRMAKAELEEHEDERKRA